MNDKDKLYYDSDCPICSAEMRKLVRVKNDSLELIPINEAEVSGSEKEALYASLHVTKANGETLEGYDANIYAWRQTKYRLVAQWFGFPPLSWCGKLAYTLWLTYYQFKRDHRF